MSEIESAWGKYPGCAIDLVPWSGRGRATFNGAVVAESDAKKIGGFTSAM